ncbi:hypothetical protein ABZ453_51105, partial [Streptomyces sp. NPDC005799]
MWVDSAYQALAKAFARHGVRVEVVRRSDGQQGFVVLARILWNLICQVAQSLPWLTATIGRSVAVAGTPIS